MHSIIQKITVNRNALASETCKELTVLFADVADSVALHDALGDLAAHQKIVTCLQRMSDIIRQHNGTVVDTIGDEIMCAFDSPDMAFHAASSIQSVLQSNINLQLSVRIGFNHAMTSVDQGRPYGDTVNVAARIVATAKAGQILLSENTYNNLSDACKGQTRHFNNMLLKGKQAPTDIYEVIWDRDDSTMKFNQVDELTYRKMSVSHVKIKYLSKTKHIMLNNNRVQLGRGDKCEMQIYTDVVSRLHSTIKTVSGKLIVVDQSTNGTFVRKINSEANGKDLDIYLHHDEWIMSGTGVISLGEPVDNNKKHLIHFHCY
jgi:adenylate cyclase